jgi:hypothetical protein
MLPPLKPHQSHNMLRVTFGDPYRTKCEFCGLTDLQDDVEKRCEAANPKPYFAQLGFVPTGE